MKVSRKSGPSTENEQILERDGASESPDHGSQRHVEESRRREYASPRGGDGSFRLHGEVAHVEVESASSRDDRDADQRHESPSESDQRPSPSEHDGGYWRSIEEHVDPTLRTRLAEEFPRGADLPPDALSRRHFLGLVGASAALAGAGSGCMQRPRERIVPYTRTPQEVIPGVPLHYASTLTRQGYAVGVIVAAREGRPIKIDGNPAHPGSLGATGPQEQAQLLQLYDPDRSQSLTYKGRPRTWRNFFDAYAPTMGAVLGDGGGVHFLLEPTTSTVVEDLVTTLRERMPRARFHMSEPGVNGSGAAKAGLEQTTGERLEVRPDLSRASTILSLDSDFLAASHPHYLRLSRQFAEGRRLNGPNEPMNRLYVVEPAMSVTGMSADHRFPTRAGDVGTVATWLLAELSNLSNSPIPAEARSSLSARRAPEGELPWVAAIARDLVANRGRSIVLVGERQPAEVHALAHLMNEALGNVGSTVEYGPSLQIPVDSYGLESLLDALNSDEVNTLFVFGGNPVYATPEALQVGEFFRKAKESVYLGMYRNETAEACDWYLPQAHPLEGWGDARAFDGTVSLVQPLIAPLYGGRTAPEVLAALAGQRGVTGHELLTQTLEQRFGVSTSGARERAIQRGMVDGTSVEPTVPETDWSALQQIVSRIRPSLEGVELAFAPDSRMDDGAMSNNPWLQELPEPVTQLTWDNALLMSPATAQQFDLKTEQVAVVRAGEASVEAPVLIAPGHVDDAITLHFGYGRRVRSEAVAFGVGVNAWTLVPASGDGFVSASIESTKRIHKLAVTQTHWSMEGRQIAERENLEAFRQNPDRFEGHGALPSMYEPFVHEGVQWAMAIDLGACTGCSACVVACQSENNIPTVGKRDVLRGREMHWLRIDRYFVGSPENPKAVTQPMLCQHCEKAPCEYVCPVNATSHSPDGLNEMTYNRCVGTRFCSNNCPYKVRRFNWFDYTGRMPPVVQLAMNPEVTVRQRGVIEKCSFCVQRIRNAEITAEVHGRPLGEGDVVTACQQVCPTRAITFGSISDPESEVSRWARSPRAYSVLEELGTRPRVRYLARITNPNPELS